MNRDRHLLTHLLFNDWSESVSLDCYCRFESCYRIFPKQAFVLSNI